MLTMNVKAMLADFLTFVTPKSMHKARFSVLLDAVTALAKDACCTVTAIGRAMPGSSDKVSIKRADRLLNNPNLQRELPLIYAALTASIVGHKRGLTLSGTKTHVKQRFLPLTPLLMVS
ncbi:hypothetical protein PTQ37_28750, partial [Klebsiella oxytoca]|nr:hypothetical protein [Klebsiella oxytoca]